ncbi:[LysW]-aminoadipate kinase [candidate division KSB1 bacterium]|nr:[LysW]-aminoadipate kinase [candidate division KSB1 bacterium]
MLIIKIGGGKSINLSGIIADLSEVEQAFIIVHGANAARDDLAQKIGVSKKVLTSISGYSSVFSDETAIDLLMMAYAGLKNKRIVELCQQHGINAVGLSGLDGKVIQGKRNSGIKVYEGGKRKIVRDFSGKPKSVNKTLLTLLLENHFTPVLSVPIIDENNVAINSENDDIVNVIQNEFEADQVIQLIEAPGFLKNPDDPASLISRLSVDELQVWEARVEGRIKRKLLALKKLFESGATKVVISDGRTEHPVRDALNEKGTVIE